MKELETFAERVRAARKNKKWTYEKLGENAGITDAAVCRIEKRQNTPTLYTAIALAKALNVSLEWLCGLDE